MTLAIFPLPDELRALADGCPTCHGEPHLIPCPECNDSPADMLALQLAALKQQMPIERSAEHLALRITEIEAEAKVLEQHADAIAHRAQTRRNTVEFLKKWLQNEMEAAQVDKFKGELATVYLQDNPPSIELVDEEKVPGEWKRATLLMPLRFVPPDMQDYITGTDILKTPIKEHIEATGEIPPGCEYRGKGFTRHLRIRTA